ncbi:MAG: trypsin-like peptidase domain-containing protein [Ruminococcus sp.]|nr:trypsin-like peptidase domain-containing protein [Ruminococcus sp.]
MNAFVKKLVSGIAALTMCLSVASMSASADATDIEAEAETDVDVSINATTTYQKGDINCDGEVLSNDLLIMKNFLNGVYGTNSGVVAERLDVNLDGVIDDNDLTLLKNISLGLASSSTVTSTNTVALPSQQSLTYYKYNATTGVRTKTYTLSTVSNISTSSTASTRSIIGDDDRVLETGLNGVVNIGNNGTAFVIDDHTLLTAAHCVFNHEDGEIDFNNTLYFEDGTVITPVSVHVPAKYVDTIDYGKYDYAIITVSEDLSSYINFNLGVARDYITTKNPVLCVTGYGPSDIGDLTTSNGRATNLDSLYIFHSCDTVGGDSGSPLYVKSTKTVIGIHFASGDGDTYNSAIRVDTDILHFVYNNSNL